MQRSSFFTQWSLLHGEAEIKGIVKGWLTISYALVRPLHAMRVTPNVLTIFGLLFAILTWPTAHTWWAPLLLVLSLICDGIDGSLAIISQTTSTRGAMIDSLADRISEVFWVLAFYELGADAQVLLIAWVAAFTQEYLRARTAGMGFKEIGAVTIAERPVRASLLFIALIAQLLNFDWAPQISLIWAVMQVLSLATLSTTFHRRLK